MNKGPWTLFWDMHSGGGLKEPPYDHIYIEAPEAEAEVVFYNKFGHNPGRVSCTCCGEDYSVREYPSLAAASGFHRGLRTLETPRDPDTGLYMNDMEFPTIGGHIHLEPGEDVPEGFNLSSFNFRMGDEKTVADYVQNEDVLVIPATDILDEWRSGDVPDQGFVWVD